MADNEENSLAISLKLMCMFSSFLYSDDIYVEILVLYEQQKERLIN